MKPSDIIFGRISTAVFRVDFGEQPGRYVGQTVGVRVERDSLDLITDDGLGMSVSARDVTGTAFCDAVSSAGRAMFCWVAGSPSPTTLLLQLHEFPSIVSVPSETPMRLAVPEYLLDDVRAASVTHAIEILRGEFLMDNTAFCVTGAERDKEGFRLVSRRQVCHIRRGPGGVLSCERVSNNPRGNWLGSASPVQLIQGDVDFVDGFFAHTAFPEIQDALNERLFRPESYLSNWEVYHELDQQVIREEAYQKGALAYHAVTRRDAGGQIEYVFEVDPKASIGSLEGVELDAAEHKPAFNEEEDEFIFPPDSCFVGSIAPSLSSGGALVTTIDPTRVPRVPPPPRGVLFPSSRGDLRRLERRQGALERVKRLGTPLTSLALLLEKGDAPTAATRHEAALTQSVVDLIGRRPTEAQIRAIDLALNTPDIALIQGPPGTGKTTVIRALLFRLAELGARNRRSKVLVTSYQHDAVDNAVEGIDIGGLPARRIGGKRGMTPQMQDLPLWEWIRDRQAVCDETLAQFPECAARRMAETVNRKVDHWRRARGLIVGYHDSDVFALRQLLSEIAAAAGSSLPATIASELAAAMRFEDDHSDPSAPDDVDIALRTTLRERLLALLDDQRLTESTFFHDGPFQAERLSKFLAQAKHVLDISLECMETVRTAATTITSTAEDLRALLVRLTKSVDTLRSELSSEPARGDRSSRVRFSDIDRLLTRVCETLQRQAVMGAGTAADAVAAYRDGLSDLGQVKRMLELYGGIAAGTCQQIARDGNDYDVVIVDEAARANPLDLLIPMARGKRIILVGDHQQLPHVLEDRVKERFRGARGTQYSDLLEESLFQRLFQRFTQVEAEGGIRRVVTLTDDFRMHPTISRFVSDTFYEGQVSAGCAAEDRALDLPMYQGKPLAFIDLPRARGAEAEGASKFRPIEADFVLSELERVLTSSPTLSIGVITFYERQAALIDRAIQAMPSAWRDRVKVGTVDAFQGREFDVVFLSTVRSNAREPGSRASVGFLSLANRLCVAFSRARRLLVAVGDSETVATVPQIRAFVDCCRQEGHYERR